MDRINSMRLSCLLLFSTAIFMSVSAYNEENWIPVNENASCLSVDKIIFDKNGVLHAAGIFVTLSGDTVEGLVRKIGDDWEPVGTIRGTVRTFTLDTAGNIYAAGNLYLDDTGSFAHFAKYDGETWSAFGGKRGSSSYNSVRVLAVDSVGNVYAGGYFKNWVMTAYAVSVTGMETDGTR